MSKKLADALNAAQTPVSEGDLVGHKTPQDEAGADRLTVQDLNAQDIRSDEPRGVNATRLLSSLLRTASSAELNILVADVYLIHEYDLDNTVQIFSFNVDEQLTGQENMDQNDYERQTRLIQNKLAAFLEEFKSYIDPELADIYPELGEIHFDEKIDILRAVKKYLKDVCSIKVDLSNTTLAGSLPTLDCFHHILDPVQVYQENLSRVVEKIHAIEKIQPQVQANLFVAAPIQPYSRLAEVYAFATQHTDDLDCVQLIAMTEQAIHHEDSLGDIRDDDFQLLRNPLKLSIN